MDIFKNGDGRIVMVMGELEATLIRDALVLLNPKSFTNPGALERSRSALSANITEFFMRQRAEVKS